MQKNSSFSTYLAKLIFSIDIIIIVSTGSSSRRLSISISIYIFIVDILQGQKSDSIILICILREFISLNNYLCALWPFIYHH